MLFRILPLALVSLFFTSCENETEKNQAALLGRWQLTKGLRNKNETQTLQGVFYHFGADGKMQTNLPIGAEGPTDYVVVKNEVEQRSAQPVRYTIQQLTDSALVMTLEMHGVPFEFQFRRVSEDTPPPTQLLQEQLPQDTDSISR